MKRYIIGLTLASALTMGLTSCSDFLEEPIRGQQDMENYFTTEEECEKQITGCYNFIACDDWWQIYKFYNLCNITTDDCWMDITQCNIAIEKIAQLKFNDEKYQKRLIAEAKFLRGFYYFELVKNFGGVPLVMSLKMPSEVQGITRATTAETYAQIEQDFKDALAEHRNMN